MHLRHRCWGRLSCLVAAVSNKWSWTKLPASSLPPATHYIMRHLCQSITSAISSQLTATLVNEPGLTQASNVWLELVAVSSVAGRGDLISAVTHQFPPTVGLMEREPLAIRTKSLARIDGQQVKPQTLRYTHGHYIFTKSNYQALRKKETSYNG